MAFEGLSEKLNAAFNRLRGKGRLTENDVREAMRELVRQAGENDNISTIYVVDRQEQYYGAIELQDLIIAREHTELEDLISRSYPFVMDHEKISECIEKKNMTINKVPTAPIHVQTT